MSLKRGTPHTVAENNNNNNILYQAEDYQEFISPVKIIFLMNVLYSECIFHVIISICATMHAFILILS